MLTAHPYRCLSWKGFNCCEWEGGQCDQHSSHVVEIHLDQFLEYPEMNGVINPEMNGVINPALFELKHLKYLDLSNNYLTGAIPVGILSFQTTGAEAFGSQLE
eukprot:Gb_05569 [translate_table: standard]